MKVWQTNTGGGLCDPSWSLVFDSEKGLISPLDWIFETIEGSPHRIWHHRVSRRKKTNHHHL
ncbi:MAG: hypothetical protein BV458_07865 [Thermoplasmata archaeon M9B2D]|nr:MAG: hypothetical protein BV458_07865 [Thermoplasmata archaeon M9B2D]